LFTVTIETQFKASHSVSTLDGTSEPEHEHFWAVAVEVGAQKLNDRGMAVDFAKLKAKLNDITSQLSGGSLNNVEYFQKAHATAESVAEYIFNKIEAHLPEGVRLEGVTVSEQVGCSAKYHK
jgi:6-pyruvoyltetrahydropterin/6-carboxytetrahydropterin synthase